VRLTLNFLDNPNLNFCGAIIGEPLESKALFENPGTTASAGKKTITL